MTQDEFEEFKEVVQEVSASYAVCNWPERFKELIDFWDVAHVGKREAR